MNGLTFSPLAFAGGQDQSNPKTTLSTYSVVLPGIILTAYFLDQSCIKKVICTFTASTPRDQERRLTLLALHHLRSFGGFSSNALDGVRSRQCEIRRQLSFTALNM